MALLSDTASFGRPAEQPIIPLPFREMMHMAATVQQRADKNYDTLQGFGDLMMRQQVLPGDEGRKMEIFNEFQQEASDIIDKSGGVMSDMSFRNNMRNLVRKYSNHNELLNMGRNLQRVNDEQEQMLGVKEYLPYNDINRDTRRKLLSGQLSSKDIGLYKQQQYLGNHDWNKKIDSYIDKLHASGNFGEYLSEDGQFIIGQGREGITPEKVLSILNSDSAYRDFLSSPEGGEFTRMVASNSGAKDREELAMAQAEAWVDAVNLRLREATWEKTRGSLSGNSSGAGAQFGQGVESNVEFQNRVSPNMLQAMEDLGFKYSADGGVKFNEATRSEVGDFGESVVSPISAITSLFVDDKGTPKKTSELADQKQNAIKIAYALEGKQPSNDAKTDMTFLGNKLNEFASAGFSGTKTEVYDETQAKKLDGTLNRYKRDFMYYDPASDSKQAMTWDEVAKDMSKPQIAYTGTLKGENPYAPMANEIEVTDENGAKRRLIASNISGVEASDDAYYPWVFKQSENYFDGRTVFSLNPAEEKQLQSKGLGFQFSKKEEYLKNSNSPYIKTEKKVVDGKIQKIVKFYENGKEIPFEEALKSYGGQ